MRQTQARRNDHFEFLGMLGQLSRDSFLDELNRFRDVPQRIRRERLGTLYYSPPRVMWDRDAYFAGLTGQSAGDRSARLEVMMNGQLRLYVDEWLQTGTADDGAEDPRDRDLKSCRIAGWAIQSFSNKQSLQLKPAPGGLYLALPGETDSVQVPRDPLDEANRLFALFQLCNWRLKLAKCRRVECGRYFELKHSNRLFKRGTFCADCQRFRSLESARRSTCSARRVAQQELYRLIAKRFANQIKRTSPWLDDPKLKASIIVYLNREIEKSNTLKAVYHKCITQKWLAWNKNRQGIKNAVQEGIHAKS